MAALVAVEALAIILLGVLVAGVLGGEPDVRTSVDFQTQPGIPGPGESVTEAVDVAGVTPDDEAVVIGIVGSRGQTIVAFLSTGCLTCQTFWDAFAHPDRLGLPAGTRLVVVTKSPDEESESGVRELAPREVPVVMSSAAWDDYQVPGSPYFVQVDGLAGKVVGEGSASSWPQVLSLLTQATEDRRLSRLRRRRRVTTAAVAHLGDRDRADLIDGELMAAGIRPGDPSLYPDAPVDAPPTTDRP